MTVASKQPPYGGDAEVGPDEVDWNATRQAIEIPSTAVELVDHEYRPTFALTPEYLAEQVIRLKEVAKSVLAEGVDYMRIPGTPKPSLLKPGAERLLQLYGFGHKMEQGAMERDADGHPYGVEYRCVVTRSMQDGREVVVSSCDGYAGRDEGKWKSAPWNTVLKMAQKRALVGAALTACAASGLFTQDLEDYEPSTSRARPQAVEKSRAEYVDRAKADVKAELTGVRLARTGGVRRAIAKLDEGAKATLREFCANNKIPNVVGDMTDDQLGEVEGFLVAYEPEGYEGVKDTAPL